MYVTIDINFHFITNITIVTIRTYRYLNFSGKHLKINYNYKNIVNSYLEKYIQKPVKKHFSKSHTTKPDLLCYTFFIQL